MKKNDAIRLIEEQINDYEKAEEIFEEIELSIKELFQQDFDDMMSNSFEDNISPDMSFVEDNYEYSLGEISNVIEEVTKNYALKLDEEKIDKLKIYFINQFPLWFDESFSDQ